MMAHQVLKLLQQKPQQLNLFDKLTTATGEFWDRR